MTDKQLSLTGMFLVLVLAGLVVGAVVVMALNDPPARAELEYVPATAPRADMECWKVRGTDEVVCRW